MEQLRRSVAMKQILIVWGRRMSAFARNSFTMAATRG
jgi:hypothetical protein